MYEQWLSGNVLGTVSVQDQPDLSNIFIVVLTGCEGARLCICAGKLLLIGECVIEGYDY